MYNILCIHRFARVASVVHVCCGVLCSTTVREARFEEDIIKHIMRIELNSRLPSLSFLKGYACQCVTGWWKRRVGVFEILKERY